MNTPTQQLTPEPATSAGPNCALATGYAPMVGDRFHKPAGTRISALDADPVPTPERNAVVTMMSDKHVVVLIDGVEYTMGHGTFIHLAEKTLANGSTLIRAS